MEMYEAMRERFGHQGWWPSVDGSPAEEKLEICVGAILTQNTNWGNVEKALKNLIAADCISVNALHSLTHDDLAGLIRPAGYYNIKAKRLKNFIAAVYDSFGDDIEGFLNRSAATLREELLAINGIGRETADSMMLYAAELPSFVVDTYTYRILLRHGVISPEDDYEAIKELFESSLPEDIELWNDYHAQLVAVGKNHCKPKAKCAGCPLEPFDHNALAGVEGY